MMHFTTHLIAGLLLPLTVSASWQRSFSSGNSFGVPGVNTTYDYIIVGGGTAGNAIAARLAQNGTFSVAVIEAGSFYQLNNGNGSVIPGLAVTQHTGTGPTDLAPLIDWNFITTPQAGANDRRFHYSRGKTLGGSSARNYLAYHRPTIGSMQKWANEVGDDAYLWQNVLPLYERSTNISVPDPSKRYCNSTVYLNSSALTQVGGPLHVSWPNWVAALYTFGNTIAKTAGLGINYDGVLSGEILGGAWVPGTIDPVNAHRDSSQTSFLDEAIATTSLKVYIQTMATKILFTNKTATSVLCDAGGLSFQLTATREVIVSAGTFQSPQLLIVSGIGPKETLRSQNITAVHHLPGVGQNMQDQPIFGVSYQVNFPTASMLVNDPAYAAKAAQEYIVNATGILSANPEYLFFEKLPAYARAALSNSSRTELESFPTDWPDVEYLPQNDVAGNNSNYMTVDPANGNNYATLAAGLMATTSIGNISITSPSMHVPPLINPNWLTTETDMEVAIEAFKRLRVLWSTIVNETLGAEYYPGANITSDADILANIRDQLSTIYHAAGTCKMGKSSDRTAVIDSHARVYGVKSLRVVDASSFPFLPPGHPMSTVYMLAEKIADDILRGE